jgi:Predicted oxidoreductases (related to aryl-alcohol dehydrogenases)
MGYKASEMRYDSMKYFRSGKSGLLLPGVSLGLWHNFGSNDNYENMKAMCFTAFDAGITHFDLANNYGPVQGSAEQNFGKILNEEMSSYRDDLIISTKAGYFMKAGPYGDWGSRKYLLSSLDQSLKRMNIDYVDIFYHHRMDPNTPLEETMGALDSAVKSGKALYAGISNYDRETTMKAMEILKDLKCPFVINQVKYSIYERKIEVDKLKEFSVENGCGLIAFSPLAQGLLTDKYLNGIPEDSRVKTSGRFLNESSITPEKIEMSRALNKLANDRGQTLAQMALSWVLRDGAVTSVLIGASKPEQIIENIGIVNHIEFGEDELKEIDKITGWN